MFYEGRAYFNPANSKIMLQVRGPGDSALGTAFAVTNGSTDYLFEDTSFKIRIPREAQGSWVLTAVLSGDSEPTTLLSHDDGQTWGVA